MKITDVRFRLRKLAGALAEASAELVELEKELYRRKAMKRAPPRRRPAESTNEAIREFYLTHPNLDNHLIAVHFRVNTARVSEALAGYRE